MPDSALLNMFCNADFSLFELFLFKTARFMCLLQIYSEVWMDSFMRGLTTFLEQRPCFFLLHKNFLQRIKIKLSVSGRKSTASHLLLEMMSAPSKCRLSLARPQLAKQRYNGSAFCSHIIWLFMTTDVTGCLKNSYIN